jgi:predicted amidophosphoribosyltransferase
LWNTFWTRGICPGCGYHWLKTQCPVCGELSPHEDWYHYPPSAEVEHTNESTLVETAQ